MKLKRIMAIVLCFAMLLSIMNFTAFAEGDLSSSEHTVAQIGDQYVDEYGNLTGLVEPVTKLEGEGTEASPYLIGSVAELAFFRDDVNAGNTYEGQYVKLTDNIDFAGYTEMNVNHQGNNVAERTFRPIGDYSCNKASFKGTFDGDNHVIANLYISGWDINYHWDNYGCAGLFGTVENATIKNLTMAGVEIQVEGGDVAAIAGHSIGDCTFENITVTNSKIATFNNGCAGIVAWSEAGNYTFKDIEIDDSVVLAGLWGSFDSSIGGVLAQANENATYLFEDVTVACRLDIYNDVTAAYKYYLYRMCGMLVGRSTRFLSDNPNEVNADNITCKNVTITIGEWANYTYIWDSNLSYSCQRVEPGYTYGGINVENYPDAEITQIPMTSIIGGGQYGYSGSTAEELANQGFDETELKVVDLAKIARCVAQIGEERYLTLQEAVNIGGNITLIANTTENITIADNATIVLDLNGNTLNGYIAPCNPASLTIKNGMINSTDPNYSAIEVNSGELTLTNVNIDSERHAIRIDGDVDATINGGIYKVLVNNNVTVHTVNVSGSAVVTIKDGTFYGPKGTPNGSAMGGSALQSRDTAVVTVEGGNFSGGVNNTIIGAAVSNVSVTGGTFDQDPVNYLAAEKQVVYDDVTGLYSVVGTWTVSATANADEVYADDIVTVVVKADGANYAGATWTLEYDSEKFEYQGTTSQKGIIKGYKEDETSRDAFTKDTELASYSFKALAQKSEVSGEFKIKEATVGTVAMSVNTQPKANTAEADKVTILLKDFTVTVYDKTDEDEKVITRTTYNLPYDAKEHTISIATVPASTVYYTYNVADGAVSEESTTAPVIKDPGTYTITYRVDVPAGYDQTATTAQTITVTIGATIPKIEVANYVSGYKLVLVYTDVDNAHFKYGDSDVLMLDVTEAGYMYTDDDGNVDGHPYKHVYGYVVPSIMLDDTTYADNDVYKAKVEFVFGGNVTPVGEYNYNVNCSVDEVVDIADVIYTRSVYNTVDANMVESYMKRILKADVTKSKEVNNDDITDVKTAWENN